jgi:hypothetical protein
MEVDGGGERREYTEGGGQRMLRRRHLAGLMMLGVPLQSGVRSSGQPQGPQGPPSISLATLPTPMFSCYFLNALTTEDWFNPLLCLHLLSRSVRLLGQVLASGPFGGLAGSLFSQLFLSTVFSTVEHYCLVPQPRTGPLTQLQLEPRNLSELCSIKPLPIGHGI